MKQVILGALVAGMIGFMPNPTPADAQSSKTLECVKEAIESCDNDFEGNSIYMAAARGYCYTIRSAICYMFDPA
ncbi:MAG: hypothetical protein PVF27_10125 [Gemmatimonadales bacterium]|jgi:hypothetical protein